MVRNKINSAPQRTQWGEFYLEQMRGSEFQHILQNQKSKVFSNLYTGPSPASFSFIFGRFKPESIGTILQQMNVKHYQSIYFPALGFELTNS